MCARRQGIEEGTATLDVRSLQLQRKSCIECRVRDLRTRLRQCADASRYSSDFDIRWPVKFAAFSDAALYLVTLTSNIKRQFAFMSPCAHIRNAITPPRQMARPRLSPLHAGEHSSAPSALPEHRRHPHRSPVSGNLQSTKNIFKCAATESFNLMLSRHSL